MKTHDTLETVARQRPRAYCAALAGTRPDAASLLRLQALADDSPQMRRLNARADATGASAASASGAHYQRLADTSPQALQLKRQQASSTVHAGPAQAAASNDTGLPDRLKQGMERLSGLALDRVKVHYNSSKPAQLQAHAYAQGSDIHLAPGQERHLPHELWHVVQQAQGRVRPTLAPRAGMAVNDDPGLEREADLMGARALAAPATPAASAPPYQASAVQQRAIQCKLVLGGVDLSDEFANRPAVVDDTYNALLADPAVRADAQLSADLQANAQAVQRQLFKWIEHAPGHPNGSHPEYGRKQQNRSYADRYSLAQGLVGWVLAKPQRHAEKIVANAVYGNGPLDAALNGVLIKLWYKIQNLHRDGLVDAPTHQNILAELTAGHALATDAQGRRIRLGHYQKTIEETALRDANPNLQHGVPLNQLQILQQPGAYTLKSKVIILHDLMEYFGTHQHWNPPTAGQNLLPIETRDETMVTTQVDAQGERAASISMSDGTLADKRRARGMGLTSGTRDEQAPNTLLARAKRLPIWAGQSMTTVRMMKLAQWAGADGFENAALALSIFAFWRKDYDHRSEYAYHTMFEVMDVAKNFQVFYRIPDGGGQHYPNIDMAGMLAKVQADYGQLVAVTQGLIQRMRGMQIPAQLALNLQALFNLIKQQDAIVRQAHAVATHQYGPMPAREAALKNIVIGLENARDIHRSIGAILDGIPAPANDFNPDAFFV